MSHHATHRVPAVVAWLLVGLCRAESPNQVTILYDSFGNNPAATLDWGFRRSGRLRGEAYAVRH